MFILNCLHRFFVETDVSRKFLDIQSLYLPKYFRPDMFVEQKYFKSISGKIPDMIGNAINREHPVCKYVRVSNVACNNKCAPESVLKYFKAMVGAHECQGETRRNAMHSMNPKHTLLRDVTLRRT